MQTLKIGNREFAVEKVEAPLKDGRSVPLYILTGKRGARYGTMRNMQRPEVMFLVHAGTGFGIPAGFESVRLTDRNGMLEVVR